MRRPLGLVDAARRLRHSLTIEVRGVRRLRIMAGMEGNLDLGLRLVQGGLRPRACGVAA